MDKPVIELIAEQAARIAELEKLVRAAFIEGFDSGRKNAQRFESYWLLGYWESSNTRAALEGKKDE